VKRSTPGRVRGGVDSYGLEGGFTGGMKYFNTRTLKVLFYVLVGTIFLGSNLFAIPVGFFHIIPFRIVLPLYLLAAVVAFLQDTDFRERVRSVRRAPAVFFLSAGLFMDLFPFSGPPPSCSLSVRPFSS